MVTWLKPVSTLLLHLILLRALLGQTIVVKTQLNCICVYPLQYYGAENPSSRPEFEVRLRKLHAVIFCLIKHCEWALNGSNEPQVINVD